MQRPARIASYLLWALMGRVVCAPLMADTVHTWVDAQGIRHFSQYAPADPAQVSETLTIETTPGQPEDSDRLQTIREVARDLEMARQQREELRAKPTPPPTPPPAAPMDEPPYVVVPYPYGAPYPPPYPYPYPYGAPYPPPQRHGPHKHKPDEHGDKSVAPKRETAAVPGTRAAP